MEGRGAHLRTPPPRTVVPYGENRYALNLANCLVAGKVVLWGGFRATGGVRFADGDIRGEVWLTGARVSAGEGYALSTQSTRFASALVLDGGFRSEGAVWLLGAKIAGTLQCSNSTFHNPKNDGSGSALVVEGAEIGGRVLLNGEKFRARGQVNLAGAKVAGGFDCSDATFVNRTKDGAGVALTIQDAEMGGSVSLSGEKFAAFGQIVLFGAKIAGTLNCIGGGYYNQTLDGTGVALDARFSAVGGAALLGGENFKRCGRVDFSSARIAGDLDCRDSTFQNMFSTQERKMIEGNTKTREGNSDAARSFNATARTEVFTLVAANAEIGGTLKLTRMTSIGEVSMWGLRVGHNFETEGARFISSNFAISAPHMHVAGDLLLTGAKVLGSIWLPHIEVAGAFNWEGLIFVKQFQQDVAVYEGRYSRLNLNSARIGAELVAKYLSSGVTLEIDLGGARAVTLDDSWPNGWGAGFGAFENTAGKLAVLNLDGFAYERVVEGPQPKPNPLIYYLAYPFCLLSVCFMNVVYMFRGIPRWNWTLELTRSEAKSIALFFGKRSSADNRLAWLRLQKTGGGDGFRPQPYRHLARALRTQGYTEAGRDVAIAEAWRSPAFALYYPLKFLFRWCFGFGFSPFNAVLTLVCFLALGWFAVKLAIKEKAMVLTVPPVASLMVGREDSPQAVIPKWPEGPTQEEPLCTNQIRPLFYVIDLMTPVVPLHQETVCDISTAPKFRYWRDIKLFLSILGKLLTTLALITFSGVLKVRAESE